MLQNLNATPPTFDQKHAIGSWVHERTKQDNKTSRDKCANEEVCTGEELDVACCALLRAHFPS